MKQSDDHLELFIRVLHVASMLVSVLAAVYFLYFLFYYLIGG